MTAKNATDRLVGKVPETRDKSEDLPRIPSYTYAPRIGRVRQMSETEEIEFDRSGLCVSVCGICLSFVPNDERKLRLGIENQFSLLSARITFDKKILV